MYRRILSAVVLAATLTACATSNDPRQGGFLGGLSGLMSGSYDDRIQKRQVELTYQKNVNQGLKEQSSVLENQAQEKESELAAAQQRLANMEDGLASLESEVSRMNARSDKQKAEITKLKGRIKEQRKRVNRQQVALNALERAGGSAADPERYRVLEQERNRLADEYKKLLEYSQALSNAAN